jgi:outer membrane protein assembly factor BamB
MSKLTILIIYACFSPVWLTADVLGNSHADYWPAWRGPDATGVALKANPPLTWSETENIKWKARLPGQGTSSPVIWGDRIFFLTAIKTDEEGSLTAQNTAKGETAKPPFHGGSPPKNVYKFDIVCLDRKTGSLLWQKTAREELPHEGHHPTHGFASYSPVTDGKYVWASFGSRGVYCYDIDGNQKWSKSLGKLNTVMSFGEGSSAALASNAVIVLMDHQGDSFIYALNKETGETIWKKGRDERTSWATPLPVEVNGKLQVVTSATNFIRSYDVKTGELIWKCSGQVSNVIPSPVAGFGLVFCTSGRRGNSLQAIELGHTGDLSGTKAVKWHVKKATPYVPSPLIYGDKFYVCSGNKAIISCYQAETGKPNFVEQRLEGIGEIYASPVGAANRVYFVGRNGKTQVIRLSEEFQVLATNTLDDKIDCSPAIVGNQLFLKGKTYLYCIAGD